jgi:hypothetical protein
MCVCVKTLMTTLRPSARVRHSCYYSSAFILTHATILLALLPGCGITATNATESAHLIKLVAPTLQSPGYINNAEYALRKHDVGGDFPQTLPTLLIIMSILTR